MDLVERFRRGDQGAFEEILERYERMVMSLAMTITGNVEEAKELSQETFLSLFGVLGSWRPDARLSTWLYRVTLNRGINWKRRFLRTKPVAFDPETLPAREGPWERLIRTETEEELHRVVSGLGRRERMVFILRGIEKLSISETADILGVATGTVKSTYAHAVEKIRDRMKGIINE